MAFIELGSIHFKFARRDAAMPDASSFLRGLLGFHKLAQLLFLVLGERSLQHSTFAGKCLQAIEDFVDTRDNRCRPRGAYRCRA
jgi:hypothetical protein